MILIAPCICKPSNVIKDVSAWKRLCQSVVIPGRVIARKWNDGTRGGPRERMGSLAPYIVHVYEVRPLRRVVEHRVILLDEALADRLVRHVHRHGAEDQQLWPVRWESDWLIRLHLLVSGYSANVPFLLPFEYHGSYEPEAAPCNIPRVERNRTYE